MLRKPEDFNASLEKAIDANQTKKAKVLIRNGVRIDLLNAVKINDLQKIKTYQVLLKELGINDVNFLDAPLLNAAFYLKRTDIFNYLVSIQMERRGTVLRMIEKATESNDVMLLTPIFSFMHRLSVLKQLSSNLTNTKSQIFIKSCETAGIFTSSEIAIFAAKDPLIAMLRAITHEEMSAVEYFVDQRGVDINLKNEAGLTFVQYAHSLKKEDLVYFFMMRGANADLMDAVKRGDLERVDWYVSLAKELNVRSDEYAQSLTSAMKYAMELNHLAIVRCLLKPGVLSPDARDEAGVSLLCFAADVDASESISILEEYGVDLFVNMKKSALYIAASKGNVACVQALLKAHNERNRYCENAYSVLKSVGATWKNKEKIIHELVSYISIHGGANRAYLIFNEYREAFMAAMNYASPENFCLALSQLKDHVSECKLDDELRKRIKNVLEMKPTPVREALLERYVDSANQNGLAHITVDLAVEEIHAGKSHSVINLLNAGLDMNSISRTSPGSILYHAVWQNRKALLKELIDRGVNLENNLGIEGCATPVMQAAHSGHVEVMKMLIDAGASLSAITKTGKSVLTWAVKNSNFECINELLNECLKKNVLMTTALTDIDLVVGEEKNKIVALLASYVALNHGEEEFKQVCKKHARIINDSLLAFKSQPAEFVSRFRALCRFPHLLLESGLLPFLAKYKKIIIDYADSLEKSDPNKAVLLDEMRRKSSGIGAVFAHDRGFFYRVFVDGMNSKKITQMSREVLPTAESSFHESASEDLPQPYQAPSDIAPMSPTAPPASQPMNHYVSAPHPHSLWASAELQHRVLLTRGRLYPDLAEDPMTYEEVFAALISSGYFSESSASPSAPPASNGAQMPQHGERDPVAEFTYGYGSMRG